jgi:hypothetical protein
MQAAQSAEETVRTQAEFTLIRYQEMRLEESKKSSSRGESFNI